MRDGETAEVAVQASMTGHLVFSTLHTNDALGAVPRLLDLGVPDYLVAATLEGVLAQRLVRKNCVSCQVTYEPPPEQVALLAERPAGRTILRRGVGCPQCRGTGFRGRVGIFELLLITDDVREAIIRNRTRNELRAVAREAGLMPLRSDGWQKVQAGVTSIEEVLRVVQE
jgi:general secretion pathway protein E